MKTKLSMAIFTGLLFITGCSSTVSPWQGLPYQEANLWRGIGVSAFEAKTYRGNGFTPSDVKPWIQAGIKSPTQVIEWKRAGFASQETSRWLKKGFNLEKAIKLKKQGLTIDL